MTASAASAVATHAGHLIVFGAPTVLLVGWVLVKKLRRRLPQLERIAPSTVLAAAASFTAAVIHGTACPEHFREAVSYGLFFLLAATAQLCWAALVLLFPARRRQLLWSGALGNLGIIGLWSYTRLVGVPLGPGRGKTEPVGLPDLLATACEVIIVGAAVLGGRRAAHQRPADRPNPELPIQRTPAVGILVGPHN